MDFYMIRRISTYLLIVLAFLLSQAVFFGRVHAESLSENDVKAAYLFNFAKFVGWPEQAFSSKTAPIVLCVLGDDPLGELLSDLESKKIKGRSISVVHVRNKDQIKTCHILYVSDSEKRDLPDILTRFGDKPCLTVSSIDNFASHGGMFGFVRKGNNIRFEANLDAIKDGDLTVSSRLLNLAQIVKGHNDSTQR